jgi:cytochrome c oxidase subunit 4
MSHGHHSGGHSHGNSDEHPLVGHLVPLWILFATAGALLVLTVITVAVRYIDLGEANIWIAIGVAAVKATLVGLYFMHLKWDKPFNQLTLVGSIVFVVLLLLFTLMDSKQYQATLVPGNPQGIQTKLGTEAPNAPIAKQVPLVR